jgi:hypothetical protein
MILEPALEIPKLPGMVTNLIGRVIYQTSDFHVQLLLPQPWH